MLRSAALLAALVLVAPGSVWGQADDSLAEESYLGQESYLEEDDYLAGDDYLEGDVPAWLEEYGYDDTHDDVPGADGAPERPGAARVSSASRPPASPSAPCDCLRCRARLTGDWWGCRSRLQERGIAYNGRVTQFFMGVGGGVNPPVPDQLAQLGIAGGDTYEYTGNSRHDFRVDLDKFGGLPHSKFIVTMENLWGRFGNVSFETGARSPAVFNALMPVDLEASGNLYCTNFMLLQPLSEQFIVTVGKTRTIGVADNNIFAGGDGSDQFINQTFVANPLMVPNIPLSTFLVGAVLPREWGNMSLSVMDPVDRSTEFMDFGSLFARGAIVFGQVQVETDFFGKPGEHHVGGFYKNVDQLDLTFTPLPPTYPEPPAPPGTPALLTRPETYALFYGFDQYVTTYGPPDARGNTEGWGVFGRAGIADDAVGNPNWAAWHVSAGIGGDSPLRRRRGRGDRFGVGYAYTGTSTEFGAIPRLLFDPRDAQIIEMYYRYRLTPAIEVTPDVQWVYGMLGGLTDGDGAIVAGIRLNLKL
jgi:porin